MTEEMLEKLKTLTPKEELYFRTMWPKYGVLFITSKPGVAKSAIALEIANKMGFAYLDMRLSMNDESDFKYPFLGEKEYNGKTYKVSGTAVPKWAWEANQRPTIIHFEELNRAPLFVRNAALQILLERKIGNFEFNDNVLMMASGNLGDEDGTDVEELDAALNNRLIHISHNLTPQEWITDFAMENCHPYITNFIKAHPEKMYVNPTENNPAYATPRTWTVLSKFITDNIWTPKMDPNKNGLNAHPRDFLPMVKQVASGMVGNSALKFIQYCEDMLNISVTDVLNRYDQIRLDLMKYNRDKNSELIQALREMNLMDFNPKQLENVAKFLKGTPIGTAKIDPGYDVNDRVRFLSGKKELEGRIKSIDNNIYSIESEDEIFEVKLSDLYIGGVGEDEKTAYLLHIVDHTTDITNPKVKNFLLQFKGLLKTIKRFNRSDN